MITPPSLASRLANFPPALRELVESELAAGNAILENASRSPAPPAGDCVRLARPITTRPRVSTDQIDFYDRNSSICSGEWTDPKRFYFVTEPPHPPGPEPDMDAIRDARNAAAAMTLPPSPPNARKRVVSDGLTAAEREARRRIMADPTPLVRRFVDSMTIDYEKWREGIGYDLTVIKEANGLERLAIEEILIRRRAQDWRDVAALAVLNSPRGTEALQEAMVHGNAEIRGAVLRYAPELVSEKTKTVSLIEALRSAEFYGGLTQALDEVAEFHPPEIVEELFRGALARKGDVACHFAATLMYVHGRANVRFDWEQRPFFLRFNTVNRAEREAAFRELCEKVGVDARRYLAAGR